MTGTAGDEGRIAAIQRRTVLTLSLGQVLGSIAFGSTVSLGALLARHVTGSDALSGLATASATLGAAFLAIPLARAAIRRGRRTALTLGNLLSLAGIGVVILGAAVAVFPLLLAGFLLIGAGNAGNLQARFAATDLAPPAHRARDLSLVVWATTIGGVTGPFLLTPGEQLGQALGMPTLTGAYLFSIVAQSAAVVLYLVALRPDPLRLAQQLLRDGGARATRIGGADRPVAARFAVFAVAGSHAVMASVMAMTPVHLSHMAHSGEIAEVTTLVGLTIGLHVAGMYALSPVFGMLADRWGRVRVVLLGQAILAAALLTTVFAGTDSAGVLVALILLGLGWSAATVAGAALLTEATAPELRPRRQGRSDSLMSLCGAAGASLAGVLLATFGYAGLGLGMLVVVIVIVALSPLGRIRPGGGDAPEADGVSAEEPGAALSSPRARQ